MIEQESDNSEENSKAPWDETIRTVLIALLLALIFRSLAYEPFHIPSGSMKNNLLVGDYLFVSKFSYGYSQYSFPLGVFPFEGRMMESQPERGDVIVFRLPANPRIDYIKRLIGLPGDRVQVRDGTVFLNGKALKRERIENFVDSGGEHMRNSIPSYRETLPDGKSYIVLEEDQFGVADNTEEFVVPEGQYFFMGDNRDNSTDSRFSQVGFVPYKNLVGRADMIFFSIGERARWYNPVSWFSAMRYNRFFTHLN
ncbi:MAG: signal peptidase I [Alphaproteobacteria bacterium]